jgi:hypothetical protein
MKRFLHKVENFFTVKHTLIVVICVLGLILVFQNVQRYMRPSPRNFDRTMMKDSTERPSGMMFPGMGM